MNSQPVFMATEDAERRRAWMRDRICCSDPWAYAQFEIRVNSFGEHSWVYLPDVFPPAGMKECPACKRIGPHGQTGLCIDCETEQEVERLEACNRRLGIPLASTSGYNCIQFKDDCAGWFTSEMERMKHSEQEVAHQEKAVAWRALTKMDIPSEPTDDEGWAPARRRSSASQLIASVNSLLQICERNKHPGTHLLLLPDDEPALLTEIEKFKVEGRVDKRATVIQRENRNPAKEKKGRDDDDPAITFRRPRYGDKAKYARGPKWTELVLCPRCKGDHRSGTALCERCWRDKRMAGSNGR